MITNLIGEDLLTLSAAARQLGCHPGTVRSYILRGDRRTKIQLEATVMPSGRLKTSVQALERFTDRLNGSVVTDLPPSERERRRRSEAAERAVIASGWD